MKIDWYNRDHSILTRITSSCAAVSYKRAGTKREKKRLFGRCTSSNVANRLTVGVLGGVRASGLRV